jgi:hypothetical protein
MPPGSSNGNVLATALHPSRQFSREFTQFIRDMLHPDPTQRPTLRESMKRSVALMMKALQRAQQAHSNNNHNHASTNAAAAAAASSTSATATTVAASPTDDDDEFGAFSSATSSSTVAASATSSAAADEGPSLESLIADMQAGSSASASSSSSSSAGSEKSAASAVPGGFLKFGRKGAPHPTTLQLSSDCTSLTYTSRGVLGSKGGGGATNTIPLSRIFAVVPGQVTAKFARARAEPTYARRAHLCLSLLLRPRSSASPGPSAATGSGVVVEEALGDPASGEETLDLLADSHQLHRTWITGLQRLLAQQQQQQQKQAQDQPAAEASAASPQRLAAVS